MTRSTTGAAATTTVNGARLDPRLADEQAASAERLSDRYCRQWDFATSETEVGTFTFGSQCGYPVVGRLADGSTACERHFPQETAAL